MSKKAKSFEEFYSKNKDDILDIDHQGKVTIRMSVNPEIIINRVQTFLIIVLPL